MGRLTRVLFVVIVASVSTVHVVAQSPQDPSELEKVVEATKVLISRAEFQSAIDLLAGRTVPAGDNHTRLRYELFALKSVAELYAPNAIPSSRNSVAEFVEQRTDDGFAAALKELVLGLRDSLAGGNLARSYLDNANREIPASAEFWYALHKLIDGESRCKAACDPDDTIPVYESGRKSAQRSYPALELGLRLKQAVVRRRNVSDTPEAIEAVVNDLERLTNEATTKDYIGWSAFGARQTGFALLNDGRYDEARKSLEAAKQKYEQVKDRAGIAWSEQGLALLLADAETKDVTLAQKYVDSALKHFRAIGSADGIVETLLVKARVREQAGDLGGAVNVLKEAASSNTLQSSRTNKSIEEQTDDLETKRNEAAYWYGAFFAVVGMVLGFVVRRDSVNAPAQVAEWRFAGFAVQVSGWFALLLFPTLVSYATLGATEQLMHPDWPQTTAMLLPFSLPTAFWLTVAIRHLAVRHLTPSRSSIGFRP